MPLATIHKVGDGNVYHVHWLDQPVDPGYGQGRPGGRPDQGLPGHGHPDQGLPGQGGRPDQGLPRPPSMGGGRPDNTLPGQGGRPDQGLPGGGNRPDQGLPGGRPGIPDNELPDHPPPQVAQGMTLVLVRQDGKWSYATIAPGSPPPKPLPGPGGGDRPDQSLPGGRPPAASQLPGQTPQPKR